MAREGISFEQVAAAADALMGEGKEPTIRAVRERLGTGSPNTVHKHLTAWRAARPVAAAAAQELPASLTTAIAAEIERAAAKARGEIEAQLVQAQAEAAELAQTGEALEAERDGLAEQVTALTTECDKATATAEERAAEIERQAQAITREQQAAEAARVELATARLKIEAQAERQGEQAAEIARLKSALEASDKARQEAAQAAAVTSAKLEAVERRATEAEAREAALRKSADEHARLLRETEQTWQQRTDAMRQHVQQEREQRAGIERELAELRGRLAVIEEARKVAKEANPAA